MIENGLYWVCLDEDRDWTIAEMANGKWWVIGCEDPWLDGSLHEIGPKVERPRLDA
jgi:hypothetical protein